MSNYFLDPEELLGIIKIRKMRRPPVIVIQLVHILGPMKGEIQEFTDPIISIGRHPTCHLHFPPNLTSISRKHAEITREGNQFKLIDHSTNGTFVNGKRVKEIYLKNGDVLEFSEGGPKVSFLTEVKEVKEEEVITPLKPETPKGEPKRPPVEKPLQVEPIRVETQEVAVQPVKAPLVIQYGPTLRSYKELPVTIGKGLKCDFIIDHPALFDQQAQIFFFQNQYWIKDLTGQRLVQINRVPIVVQASLKPNDEIALTPRGPTFRFLGEGRLAEVQEAPMGEFVRSSEIKKEVRKEDSKEKEPKGLKSVFKKIIDR